jgi:hypothetical protein
MHSSYQHHATSYANLALGNAHEINSDLHRQAEAIAPRFAEETADAGCTNLRPGDDQPRRQKAWDLIAEALAWNLIADDPEAVAAAIAFEKAGKAYQVGYAWSIASGDRYSYQQPFVIDLNGGDFLTYAQVNEIEKTVAKGQAVIVLDAVEIADEDAYEAHKQYEWEQANGGPQVSFEEWLAAIDAPEPEVVEDNVVEDLPSVR